MRLSTLLTQFKPEEQPVIEAFYTAWQNGGSSLDDASRFRTVMNRIHEDFNGADYYMLSAINFLVSNHIAKQHWISRIMIKVFGGRVRNTMRYSTLPKLVHICEQSDTVTAVLVYVTGCLAFHLGEYKTATRLLRNLVNCNDTSLEINALTIQFMISHDSLGNPKLLKAFEERGYDPKAFCYEMNLFAKQTGDADLAHETLKHMTSSNADRPLVLILEGPRSGLIDEMLTGLQRRFYGMKPVSASNSRAITSQSRRY